MELGLRVFLFLVVSCVDWTACLGQDSYEHEYVFTIPTLKGSSNTPLVMITTTSKDPVVATLSIPGYVLSINRTITRKNGTEIELPVDIRMNPGDGKQNKTVIVRASGHVSVYAMENEVLEGDAFQCIPYSHLGTKYSVVSYRPNSRSSCICVSALQSPTTVTISTATDLKHSIILKKYESYRYDGGAREDLSGLLVHGTKPIAIITGSVPNIPFNKISSDSIVAQLSPTVSWGSEYYLFPFQSLQSGFVYRVSTFNVTATLYFSDGTLIDIQPGHFYEGDVSGDTEVSFESDQPVTVAQYMKGYGLNTPGRGDPSMFIVPPVSAYFNQVTFPVFEYTHPVGHAYYINIVTQCVNINGIIFDEAISVSSWNRLTTSSHTICCVRNEVSTGYHSVTHTNPNAMFFVYVYAMCNICGSSYAYAASGIYELAKQQTTMLTTDKVSLQTDQQISEAKQQTAMLTTDIVSLQTDKPASGGCPKFTTPENGSLQPDKDVYTFGQVVIVYCRKGFNLIGDERLTCTDTGDWHGEIPTCIQSNPETPVGVITISASVVGGVVLGVLIAIVLIFTICYCRKRCKTAADDSHYYSSNVSGRHPAPAPKDNSKLANPNTDSRDADNERYETPRDNAAYQDLELSTMTSSEQEYHGLYAQAS